MCVYIGPKWYVRWRDTCLYTRLHCRILACLWKFWCVHRHTYACAKVRKCKMAKWQNGKMAKWQNGKIEMKQKCKKDWCENAKLCVNKLPRATFFEKYVKKLASEKGQTLCCFCHLSSPHHFCHFCHLSSTFQICSLYQFMGWRGGAVHQNSANPKWGDQK